MSKVLGEKKMREIMKKALARFYPEDMAALFGTVNVPEYCYYFESEQDEVIEHLSFLKAALYHHSGEIFVLDMGFYTQMSFSQGFQANYRIHFHLSDLEVA